MLRQMSSVARKPHAPRFVRLGAGQLESLFGPGARLQPRIEIAGDRFVAKERLAVVGLNGRFDGVAIVGPSGDKPFVRLGPGDVDRLGLDASGGLLLVGPQGEVRVTEGIESAA